MQPDKTTKLALTAVQWIGSPFSIAVHTLVFIICFCAVWFGYIGLNEMLLGLTTIVSLEAIYLALFIQLTVNFQSRSIAEVEKDIDEMQEDVDEIQEDIDEIQEDVEDISEDVEEMSEEELEEERRKDEQKQTLSTIQNDLRKLMGDIEKLQSKQ